MMTDPAASQPGTHLDPDLLADLVEGLLEAEAADAARAHLASCPLCSSDFALIAGEAGFNEAGGLGSLLPPAPIPQDVVIRIEAALHREPPLAGAASPAPASHTVRPRRRRFRLALGALAGAALVVAGGVGVLSAVNSGGGSNSVASSGTNSNDRSESGGPPAAGQAPNAASPQRDSPGGASPGDPKFSNLTIEAQAEQLLGTHAETPNTGTTQTAKTPCAPSAALVGTKPLGSAQTAYQGKPALLLVYAEPGDPAHAAVYVVDPVSCTSGDIGHVVYQTEVARP